MVLVPFTNPVLAAVPMIVLLPNPNPKLVPVEEARLTVIVWVKAV